jgi:hypothetical protein
MSAMAMLGQSALSFVQSGSSANPQMGEGKEIAQQTV